MISPAINALMHNASFLTYENWKYFFNYDGTPTQSWELFKLSLERYFQNGSPKVKLGNVAFQNIPLQRDNNTFHTPCLYDPWASFSQGNYDSDSLSPLNVNYGYRYDAEGLINTKTIIPVLPYPSPISILRQFEFIIVYCPEANPSYDGGEGTNYTWIDNNRTEEVYDYLLNLSKYADLFITDARIFCLNYTQSEWNPIYSNFINHSELTGLLPPYIQGAYFLPEYNPYLIKWNCAQYNKDEQINFDNKLKLMMATPVVNCSVIATINDAPWIWQYNNPYGHKVYTQFVGRGQLAYDTRYLVMNFIEKITKTTEFIESGTGVILFTIEYNSTNILANRSPKNYLMNTTGNCVLYAPFNHSEIGYEVILDPKFPYAYIVNITGAPTALYIEYCDKSITSVFFANESLTIIIFDPSNTTFTIKIYCGEYGKPLSVQGNVINWDYDTFTELLTINGSYSLSDELDVRWK